MKYIASTAVGLLVLAACTGGDSNTPNVAGPSSSSTSSTSSTSSGGNLAVPQVILGGTISSCADQGPLIQIGSFGTEASGSQPVPNGQPFGGGQVTLSCTVKPSGTSFDVDASIALTGPSGGSFSLEGTLPATGDGTIDVVTKWPKASGEYSGKACKAQFGTPSEGVATGRLWVELTCPDAAKEGATGSTCAISAQIRIENCAQE
jgi:hypothetical protein